MALRPWPTTLELTALIGDTGLRDPSVPSLKFVGLHVRKIWHTFDISINRPGGLLTLSKLVRFIVHGVGNLNINFDVSVTFLSRLMVQQLSHGQRNLATLTFDLGGCSTWRWHGSSWSICEPSLKFVDLPFRKILHTYGVSINQPGDLDIWYFDLETGALYCAWCVQTSHQFWCFCDFSFLTYLPMIVI